MFDIKRIRERAADWLIDVGYSTLLRLGDAAEIVRGVEAQEEVFKRGNDSDDELRARIRRTFGCDGAEDPAAPRIEVRNGVEWLVGPVSWSATCIERSADRCLCSAHVNGEHVSLGERHGDARRVYRRWPIDPAADTSSPAGQDHAPHPPGGGQPVDGAAPFWGWMAMAPQRRDLLIRWLLRQRPVLDMSPGKADAVHVYALRALRFGYGAQTKPDARLAAYIAWLEAQRPMVDGEALSPGLIGAACDLLRGATLGGDVPPGPGGAPAPHGVDAGQGVDANPDERSGPERRIDASYSALYDLGVGPARALRCAEMAEYEAAGADPERWHRVLVDLVRTVDPDGFAAFESASAVESFRMMLRDAARWAVKPPHNAEPGALGEAREVGVCSRPSGPGCAMAQPMSGPCSCGAPLILAGVVAPPDPFVLITPEALGYVPPADLCAIAAEATRATDGAAPALAAGIEEQRLSHGGCTRLPPEMLTALGVKDGDMLWFLRSTSGGRWEAWTEAELDQQFGMGDAAKVNAAADRMPHHVASLLTAGEARRLEAKGFTPHIVWSNPVPWYETDDADLARLREEAAPADDPVPADAPPLECQIHPTELDASCALCALPADRATPPVASAAERVPESPSGGAGASSWRGLEHEVAPCRIYPGEWIVEAIDHASEGEIYGSRFNGPDAEERAREYAALMSEPAEDDAELVARLKATLPKIPGVPCDACGKPTSTGRCFGCTVASQGTEAARATLVDSGPPALPKPSRVEVSQRWRCVGVDGELVVRWVIGDGASARLGPIDGDDIDNTIARTADMLGLREWSYVGGAR